MRALFSLLAVTVAVALVKGDEEKIALDKLPKAVVTAVKKRFPTFEMKEASIEKEDGKIVYEVTLKHEGKTTDVTLNAEGKIQLIEQEIGFKSLPAVVAKTFKEKYPKAKYEILETVTKVVDGKETLEYYEATLIDAGKKKWEVEVLPDGKLKSAKAVTDEK